MSDLISAIGERFINEGYVVQAAEDLDSLDRMQTAIVEITAAYLGLDVPLAKTEFLDQISKWLDREHLNGLKLHLTNELENTDWFRKACFESARSLLESVVGNELAIQKNFGLSILLPGDASSIVELHSDVWGSECSPFEVVLWIPFVNCYSTKGIFICPPEVDKKWRAKLSKFASVGIGALYREMESELIWPRVPFGSILLFSPTLMHGGVVNMEKTTRWSINLRFKGLFSPYAGKRLGEYFEPLNIRPATRVGMDYEDPAPFDE